MKKFVSVLLLGALLLSGCSAKKEVPTSAPGDGATVGTEENAPVSANAFYKAYTEATTRPVAVMVDNDNSDAWPHAGLTDAYLIYEVPVEGGATRLMALFGEVNPEKIGPVRSSRHYFLDYALEHDAIYTHFGYSPQALADIPALGVNNINGVVGPDSSAFWRENKYVGDYHSAFTSMEKICAMADSKGYRTEREKAPLNIAPEEKPLDGGETAETVKIPYAGFYSSSFSYDAAAGTYEKFMNGSPHRVQGEDKLAVKNIIVMQMKTYSLGDGSARINAETVGSGSGYYITLGKSIPITWEKTGRSAKTVWKNADGEEIELNPGQTWVMLLPSGVSPQIG
ncbi:MAG: DUF3048 domain-containing protein [Ruminococcaceae bacterium]|nr:DUF3048 domain-containing protein [Oscillospiraceae bacterium]